ncbi:hypothetical protein CCR75_001872 [Bremia lactucae]|uniref:F-box domain-containing protein n=1 Tax=Bremia lactucae TaxID=4779 RepID=A0A976FJ78_BRELC|nr:hypothetical protein CCR75_001872 [Bremia lactucae]
MELLPLALQREICSFTAATELIPQEIDAFLDNHRVRNFATHFTEPSASNLQRLARVCRNWRDIVKTLCAEHEASRVLTIRFTTGHELQQQKQIIKRLATNEQGFAVLDLRIILTIEKRRLWWDLDPETQNTNEEIVAGINHFQTIDWGLIFALCPNLQRLDLSGMPLHHLALRNVLDKSSKTCKHLEALILPKRDKELENTRADINGRVFCALHMALHRWKIASEGKGLRQLTVPSWRQFDLNHKSNEYLTMVRITCPNLEYLDGWKRLYSEGTNFVTSEESLRVSLVVWQKFCASCLALREFSWIIVPFSDDFFLSFGHAVKPFLTRLQLAYNTRSPFHIRRNEYSTGALNIVLAGCPALKHLDIVLHRLQPCDTLLYPQIDEMIDPTVFNDDFCVALTDHCPQLRSLHIRMLGPLSNNRNARVLSGKSITDRGLAALQRASRLSCIDIEEVRCSSNLILTFLKSDTDRVQAAVPRRITFRELGVCFGEVVQNVLEELGSKAAPISTKRLVKMPLVLSLSSRRGYVFGRNWLVTMQQAFQQTFPNGDLRFAAFCTSEKDTFRTSSCSSLELEKMVKTLTRAWVRGDVLRVKRLILYTNLSALDKQERHVLERKIKFSSSWIVLTE